MPSTPKYPAKSGRESFRTWYSKNRGRKRNLPRQGCPFGSFFASSRVNTGGGLIVPLHQPASRVPANPRDRRASSAILDVTLECYRCAPADSATSLLDTPQNRPFFCRPPWRLRLDRPCLPGSSPPPAGRATIEVDVCIANPRCGLPLWRNGFLRLRRAGGPRP